MSIKPSQFPVIAYERNGNDGGFKWSELKVHTRVCSRTGVKTLGVITSILPIAKDTYKSHQLVTVKWFSGKKKGKETTEEILSLSDYDAYKMPCDRC